MSLPVGGVCTRVCVCKRVTVSSGVSRSRVCFTVIDICECWAFSHKLPCLYFACESYTKISSLNMFLQSWVESYEKKNTSEGCWRKARQ